MVFGRRQTAGILGMVLAVAGGASWFFGQYFLAAASWAAAFVVLAMLRKKRS